jgi:5-methylcytosine-specific restriction endonuclease McrA
MHTSRAEPAAVVRPTHPALHLLAREPESPWEAKAFDDLVPPATLAEARERRDELARLLGRERTVAADFLLALADFDRRRGWERLGHASLFAFLNREFRLSNGAAWARSSAARLLPRFPAVEAALRDGRLCLSTAGELARVLTVENQAEVLPRFFGCSFREAKELAAAILPDPKPPTRDRVRLLTAAPALAPATAQPEVLPRPTATPTFAPFSESTSPLSLAPAALPAPGTAAPPLRAPEVGATQPSRAPSAEVRPLTADLRRLSVTVSATFLAKVAKARDGLSHTLPRASTEQVLEAALDLLLEKQARRKARAIPAAIEREVRLRDGNRCQFPLDAGGRCGSTWQVELDHVIPRALGGPTTAANLRCACRRHNQYAAEVALGAGVMSAARGRGRR